MISKKLFLFSFFAIFLLTAPAVSAQEAENFDTTVSPTFVELSAKPGTTVNQSVRLRNNTAETTTLIPEVKIMGGDEAGNLTIKETQEEHISWLVVGTEEVVLRPNEWTTVPFTITIPETAAYGYYWAVTFTAPDTTTTDTGTAVSASIAVPVLLTVEKEGAKTEAKLLEFKTGTFYYEYPPIDFLTTIQNTGNVHIRPQGNIFIKDFLGRTVATLNINETQAGILPGLKRTFENTWNDGFITNEPKMENGEPVTDENGNPETEMKIHWQKILDLRIGKYDATALVLVSGSDRDYTYEQSTSFFVFPWKVILVLIGIVILVGIGLFTTSKAIFRKIKGWFSKK